MIHIGLIGDHNHDVIAHQAIPLALNLAQNHTGLALEFEWVATDSISTAAQVADYDGIWCVPASPYRSEAGALLAIQFARLNALPFLGTCGGFQHLVLEYARNVLGWADAEHGESNPSANRAVIAPLACSMVEVNDLVRFETGSRIAKLYQSAESHESYHCRYGLNPAFTSLLASGPLRASAFDSAGAVRAVELDAHPFYMGTLFQPERAALTGILPPLADAFVRACGARREGGPEPAGVRNG